jgi:hypothetical protein
MNIRSNRTTRSHETTNIGGEQLDDGIGDTLVSVGALSHVRVSVSIKTRQRARCTIRMAIRSQKRPWQAM